MAITKLHKRLCLSADVVEVMEQIIHFIYGSRVYGTTAEYKGRMSTKDFGNYVLMLPQNIITLYWWLKIITLVGLLANNY